MRKRPPKPKKTHPEKWIPATHGPMPRLSCELLFVLAEMASPLERCQACGLAHEKMQVWMEHDERDLPDDTYVVLCAPCADKLISPHPRFYSYVMENTPAPGAMPLCGPCVHRVGSNCYHPDAKRNEGPGVTLTVRKAILYHLDGGFGPRGSRAGMVVKAYPEPVESCAQRETLPTERESQHG